MHDPRDIAQGQRAINAGYLDQDQARRCLAAAEQSRRSFVEVAREQGLISDSQAANIGGLPDLTAAATHGPEQTPSRPPTRRPSGRPISGRQRPPTGRPVSGRHRPPTGRHRPPTGRPTSGRSPSQRPSGRPATRAGVPKVNEWLDDFLLKRILGQGSMGVVYLGERNGVDYAIKLIPPVEDPSALVRFEREAQALAAVDRHPNIVTIHSFRRCEDLRYFVLDRVIGESLDKALSRGVLEPERALAIVAKIARALDFIHERGIIHRDLKPSNILLRAEDGEPLLSDFGLVKQAGAQSLTQAGLIVGSPAYMAPEQIRADNDHIGPRSDIWGLGVILYELCTGALPFPAQDLYEVSKQIQKIAYTPPSRMVDALPPAVETIIGRALKREPHQRYRRAIELAEDCERALEGRPLARQGDKRSGAKPVALIAGGLALALVLGAGGIILSRESARRSRYAESVEKERDRLAKALKECRYERAVFLAEFLYAMTGLDRKLVKREASSLERARKAIAARDALLALRSSPQAIGIQDVFRERVPDSAIAGIADEVAFLEEVEALRQDPNAARDTEAPAGPLGDALSLARSIGRGQLDEAKALARRIAELEGADAAAGRFALAVIELRAGRYDAAAKAFKAARANADLRAFAEVAYAHAARRAAIAGLVDADDGRARRAAEETGGRWPKLEEADRQELLAALVQAFKDRPREPEAELDLTLAAYERLRRLCERELPFPRPRLGPELHALLARRAEDKDQRLLALRHHFALRADEPEHRLPESLRDQKLAEVFTNRLIFARGARGNDQMREYTEIFDTLLDAGRAGYWIPYVIFDWIKSLDAAGVIDRKIARDPNDVILRYWRGLLTSPQLEGTALNQAIKAAVADLSKVVDSEQASPVYRARARFERAFRIRELRRLQGLKPDPDGFRKQLTAALADHYPAPDDIYLELYDLDASSRPAAETIKLIESAERWARERNRRTPEQDLFRGRPIGSPLQPLLDEDFRPRLSAILYRKTLALLALGRPKEALAAAREGAEAYDQLAANYALGRALIACGQAGDAARLLEAHPEWAKEPSWRQLALEVRRAGGR